MDHKVADSNIRRPCPADNNRMGVGDPAAASILAKTTRDRIMVGHHAKFPVYGFDRHKGYGCQSHMDAIREHGACAIHRKSFRGVKAGCP
ncbi:MAG: hypothetical protein HZA22_08480 [Nitrospirae bacterium]|nr:hypothetical protein [Nitrospirota bacterium]MBI5695133.1 hypothetical protein [Nitrospirota bacterium]